MKWMIFVITALSIITLLVCTGCITPSKDKRLNQILDDLMIQQMERDSTIKSCSMALTFGDDSYSWSGAAGKSIFNQEFPMTNKTPYYYASITKTYTATAIMMLFEQGKLSLEDPISLYLPYEMIQGLCVVEGMDYTQEITIAHLLSQTSGIADYYSEPLSNGTTLFDHFRSHPEKIWTVDDTIEVARVELQAHFPPGERAHYSDTNYQLLGKILESITGKPLHRIYQELIWDPLGLENTWLVNYPYTEEQRNAIPADIYYDDDPISVLRQNGSYWADGGIISTAGEGIQFLKALRHGELVGLETLERMMDWQSIDYPMQYGMGLDRLNHPRMPKMWGHSGSTSAFLYYYEDLDLYIAGTLNLTDANRSSFEWISQVIRVLTDHEDKEGD